jgi:hypothetical protein
LPWLEELCARPAVSLELKAPRLPEKGALLVPVGALYVAETGETLSPREIEVLGLVARGPATQISPRA